VFQVNFCGFEEMDLHASLNSLNNNNSTKSGSNNNLISTSSTSLPLLASERHLLNCGTTERHLLNFGTSERHLLNCGICHGRYSNPKLLPCLHTFCEHCLSEYIPGESLSVTCPVCRQQSILPEEGVSALQTNIFINSIMEPTGE